MRARYPKEGEVTGVNRRAMRIYLVSLIVSYVVFFVIGALVSALVSGC